MENIDFIETNGRYGWHSGLYYRGINIYYGGSREDICLEISGTGCRTVEELSDNTFDWFSFLHNFESDIVNGDVNISRLDIAGDDKEESILNYGKMILHCKHKRYICKARWNMWTDGNEQAIYFGSPKSDRRLRIYNKAMEQGTEGHWIRCEMQMRNANAVSFLLNWFRIRDIGECYAGVLFDFLRFTKKDVNNANYKLVKVCPWWTEFVGAVRKCPQLYLNGGTYSMGQVFEFLQKQAASSLKLWLEANNGDMTDLLDMINGARLNHRQEMLLSKIREDSDQTHTITSTRSIYDYACGPQCTNTKCADFNNCIFRECNT